MRLANYPNRFAAVCLSLAILGIAPTAQDALQSETAPPPTNATTHELAKKLTLSGVPDFGEITPTLYRGSQPTRQGLRNLADMGIAIVVDVRSWHQREAKIVESLGMQYVSIPWQCFHPTDNVIAKFLQLIRDHPGKKIFIHCHIGDDRVGMEIAAYRMVEQGWTAKEARQEMTKFGQNRFHQLICWQLLVYEKHFPEHFKKDPAFAKLRASQPASPSHP